MTDCALGERWGFHQFPPDPADDAPFGAGRLPWRAPAESEGMEFGAEGAGWLGADPARIALGLDRSLPLRERIERANRYLQ